MSNSLVGKLGKSAGGGGDLQAIARHAPLDRAYRQHWDEICRYVRKRFGSGPPEPEDVAQATFARYAALAAPEAVDNPRAFLFRTAHNIAVDARRRTSRGEAIAGDPAISAEACLDFSPEDVLVSRDELARLDRALMDLKPKVRVALLLHRLDGLSFAEIGRRLGVSPSGARSLVDRGFEACAAAMKRRTR